MAVGRHRAESTNGKDADGKDKKRGTEGVPARANHELLGWGLFLSATAAAAMLRAGIAWPVTAGCCLLLLLSFAVVWRVQAGTGRNVASATAAPVAGSTSMSGSSAPSESAALASDPAPAAEPVPSDPAPAAEPVPAEPCPGPASGASVEPSAPITRRQMRAADPTTGLLPVVPVFARAVPLAAGNVRKGRETVVPGGRRERRHAPAAPAPVSTQTAVHGPAAQVPATDPADGELAAESRWTRTFGPPETGQLPVQRYVAGIAAGGRADPDLPDRRQRSHSSL